MELLRERFTAKNSCQSQIAVFDLVGELLAITLEKYDVEVVVDYSRLVSSQNCGGSRRAMMPETSIDCEEILETDQLLEVTISGTVEKDFNRKESFMFFFSLAWEKGWNMATLPWHGKDAPENTMWLEFGHKAEQITDSLFRVSMYRKKHTGQQHDIGKGHGFLVFGRERSGRNN